MIYNGAIVCEQYSISESRRHTNSASCSMLAIVTSIGWHKDIKGVILVLAAAVNFKAARWVSFYFHNQNSAWMTYLP